ncbi:hypothetical protein ElyMa_005971400 [Elysia marginata]|uniref:Uncharacterized protein n=1 Tax=Elysia marginata TaxID=1093978 RepID=A0AAV4GBY1_9GAST|nr:hypothetical protein ElyMa_005971400 [Elysia marginata]
MAYELGVITTIQLMERILGQNGPICLSWDATTVDGAHINEIHLTLNRSDCLTLDVRHIPGGKASDYVSHIVSSLTEAADTYSRYVGKPQQEIFHLLKTKISCTLSDRAAVNACVTRQLRDEFDSTLLQLNCNIHPLDSVARRAKQNLVKLDTRWEIKGSCFGSDGSATNLINAVSVLRFKDGSGDPAGFKDMLRRHNLPMGTFVRYVGNRMHVLFHLAGVIVLHYNKVMDFLQTRCTSGGLLRSRLLNDLKNDKIIAQVWALAVIGKVFTGPWMTKFYSSEMSNLDMRPLVKRCEQQLQLWLAEPDLLMTPTMNAFGEPLSPADDSVLTEILCFISGEDAVQMEALRVLIQACMDVLNSQLGIFIKDPEPSPICHSECSLCPHPQHGV